MKKLVALVAGIAFSLGKKFTEAKTTGARSCRLIS